MSDLIKRSDAIEAVKRVSENYTGKGKRDYHPHVDFIVDELKYCVPSADRPQGWIPCSERQPEKAGHYLCSFKKPNFIDNIYVDLAYWTGGRWYGYSANAINAWMPLPAPWKGADDED